MSNGGIKSTVVSKPARWWIGTIPYSQFPDINCGFDNDVAFATGQREVGGETGYEHWQLVVNFKKPQRLSGVKKKFGGAGHWEPTRSESALGYVVKDESSVPGTRFEYGAKPMQRGDPKDWVAIRDAAMGGRLQDIPADIYVRCYNQLRRIESDNLQPAGIERKVQVYWGRTGSGKSRRAWEEAGLCAYPKDPRSKFWDGYRGHQHVVIDEFRGGIDISHMLRWLDRYPCVVEVKGSSTVLKATSIWITSNIPPQLWYVGLDNGTVDALLRRMEVVHFE